MNIVESFAIDYRDARAKFLAAAQDVGAALQAFKHPVDGPDGEMLFVDVARVGGAAAERAIVLISGTHGVEGFCGSGAQVDILRRGEILGAAGTDIQVLMIHAINPYGFAWHRRVTHENIDLNRNWIDHRIAPRNIGYDELHEAIVPRAWDAASLHQSVAAFEAFGRDKGATAFKQALGGGQYHHPHGLYYGGQAPSWSRQIQTAILQTYLSEARDVAILDFHTGLGPFGFCEILSTGAEASENFIRARAMFGASVKSTVANGSIAANVSGDGLTAAIDLLPHAQVTPVALEFGTLLRERVFTALRADAWLHAHGDLNSSLAADIKRDVRDAYYCDNDQWKGMVVGQSMLAWRSVIAALGKRN